MLKVTSKDGTTIAYDKKGRGPLLILVLGALNRRSQGKKLTELLADRFTVVSYDRRGRGDSTNTMPYAPEREVEDIEALIDACGGTAFLYGHSSGCILALLAAWQLSDKVASLALYELPYNHDPDAKTAAKTYRHQLSQMLDKGLDGDAVALFVKSVGVSDKQIDAMRRLPMWKGLTGMAPTLAYDTIALMEHYPEIDVRNIAARTVMLYGGKSPAFMEATATKLADALPQAEVQAVEGQVHDVKADVLAPILAAFFGQV